jgi:hypothetical protein
VISAGDLEILNVLRIFRESLRIFVSSLVSQMIYQLVDCVKISSEILRASIYRRLPKIGIAEQAEAVMGAATPSIIHEILSKCPWNKLLRPFIDSVSPILTRSS